MERRFSDERLAGHLPPSADPAPTSEARSKRILELLEGGVAGAAEAIDGLIVVTHDDHVVRLVWAAPDQLQQQDLGHVGVLELVHQDVPELVLVAAQDVGPLGQQLDGACLLLAEIEQPALAAARRW